MTEDVIAA